jgi:nucleotide-binding universal stress UspA family protein
MATNQIVVGVDTSSFSNVAVRWSGEEAKRGGATLKLVHVWEHSPNYLVPTKDIVALSAQASRPPSQLLRTSTSTSSPSWSRALS